MDNELKKNELVDEAATPRKVNGMTRRQLLKAGLGTAAVALAKPVLAKSGGGPRIFRIHPAIGVARVGNADPSTFFIGPEIPGMGPLGEAPGTTVPPYKVNGLIKPQAARFRIFEYAYDGDGVLTPIGEVTLDTPGVTKITWTAHLANRKASFHKFYGPHGETLAALPLRNASVADRSSLETDFGPLSIGGSSVGPVVFQPGASGGAYAETWPKDGGGNAVIDYLGQLRTDVEGRLILLGGKGKSASNTNPPAPLPTYANNDGWFDDVSDGPVTAVVTVNGADVPMDPAGNAWVLVAPPDFAPQIENAVSQYDLHYDVALRNLLIPANNALYRDGGPLHRLVQLQSAYTPGDEVEFPGIMADFDAEIRPILLNAYKYWWVDHLVTHKHDSLLDPNLGNVDPQYAKDRQGVFVYLRPPGGAASKSGPRSMPHLLGDDPYLGQEPDYVRKLTLTRTQFGLLRNWMMGNFLPPSGLPPGPATITPHGLDKAALENCVGGAFFPGIEASWQIRNPELFVEPFRIDLNATSAYLDENGVPEGTPIRAGHFSRQMAVPWHADFNDCRNEGDFGWWPAQRPADVYDPASDTRIPWARADGKFASGGFESTHNDMQENWWKFGFVVPTADAYVETERNSPIP